ALQDFIISVGSELVGEKAGELVAKYGPEAFETGLKKLGLSNPCSNSFSAETLILTKAGLRPIFELIVGDIVYTYNEETGESGWYPVTATMAHLDPVIVHLTIDGELVVTTPEHPFYELEIGPWLAVGQYQRGWTNAGELKVGDLIWQADGSTGAVESVEVVALEQWMYNLTVADAHTFFVGHGQWLVHNCGGNIIGEWTLRRDTAQDSAIGEVVSHIRGSTPMPTWVTRSHHFGRRRDIVRDNSTLNLPDGPTFRLYDVSGSPAQMPGGRGPRRLAVGMMDQYTILMNITTDGLYIKLLNEV
ncbi:MAG: polymorphic toxin-type HINT domain-containing protein, partial [Chloroflexota bacterium]